MKYFFYIFIITLVSCTSSILVRQSEVNYEQKEELGDSNFILMGETKSPIDSIIKNVRIEVTEEGNEFLTTHSDKKGRFEFILEYGKIYQVEWGNEEHITRIIEFNLTELNMENNGKGGFEMVMHVPLFEPCEGEDWSFMLEPLGKCRFDSITNDIKWSKAYYEPRIDKMNAILEARIK